jgi:acylphosphatase
MPERLSPACSRPTARALLRPRAPVLQEPHRISGRITRRFLITGKVQGVYFRHSTRLQAERLDVRGVARNLPDGSVEVIAHGTPEAVKSLREWLDRGPSGARVAAVQEFELPAEHPSAGDPSAERLGEGQDGHSMRSFWVE